MSTLNGFGTLYYGWRHAADGTATASKWLALSWVPVVPLRRERLRVLTDFQGSNGEIRSELGGLVVSQVDRYEIIEKLPLSPREVLMTLAKTYIGLPLLLAGPLLLLTLVMLGLREIGVKVVPGSIAFDVFLFGLGLVFLHFLLQIIWAIRRTRGWQPQV